jgi:two-component system OmpR family sensor kinase
MSLHARLVTAVTVLAVVLLGGALSAVWLSVRATQQEQLDVDLRREAIEQAHDVAARGGRELGRDPDNSPSGDDSELAKYGVIFGVGGEPVAWTPTLEGRVPPASLLLSPKGTCFDAQVAGEWVRGILVDIPRRSGSTLFIAASRAGLDADLGYLARALLIAFAAVVVLTAVSAARIVRRFTRDYTAIADVTRRVAEGDLGARVQLVRGDSELGRQQRDFNAMIERLETLLSSHKRFIAHAAHEFRSPLATLYGELSLALRRERTNEAYRFTIEQALDATRRLNTLADDLLALARLDAGLAEPWKETALEAIFADAERAIAGEIRAKQVSLEVAPTAAVARTHGSEIERLLRNLLENAVRHSPVGGVVRVGIAERSEGLDICVTDDGPGVADVDREKVFEPFWRGAEQQASGARGAGLGLAIARQIARAHGGDVILSESLASRGACFRVILPISSTVVARSMPRADRTDSPGHLYDGRARQNE